MPDVKHTLTPIARQVLEVLVLIAVVGLGAIQGYRFVQPAQAAPVLTRDETVQLRDQMDRLSTRLDHFNTRLSWLEGATSSALKGDPPKDPP